MQSSIKNNIKTVHNEYLKEYANYDINMQNKIHLFYVMSISLSIYTFSML
jgi:hypothetical protein